MSSSADLLVRADAGPDIGGGHVMRCLALAQAARRRGGRVTLLTRAESSGLTPRWRGIGAEVAEMTAAAGTAEDARSTLRVAREGGFGNLVLDGYRFGAAYRATLAEGRRNGEPRLLVVDDLGGVDLEPGDVVLNPALDASRASYGPHGQVLLGAPYILLRDEFVAAADGPARGRSGEQVENLVVTVGASDPDRVTARILASLASLPPPPGLTITVIIGPDNPHLAELRALAGEHGLTVAWVTAPPNMAPLLAAADAAVSAAGSTVWELAFGGCPSLLLVLADNQRPNGESLAKRGACLLVDLTRESDPAVTSALQRLLGDSRLRAELAATSRTLVDGQGRERVLDALASASPPPRLP